MDIIQWIWTNLVGSDRHIMQAVKGFPPVGSVHSLLNGDLVIL